MSEKNKMNEKISETIELMKAVISTARNWAFTRVKVLKKHPNSKLKVSEIVLRDELETASIMGELSCLERILGTILLQQRKHKEDNKVPYPDTDWIENELHFSMVGYNNYISKKLKINRKITIDALLKDHGYYD